MQPDEPPLPAAADDDGGLYFPTPLDPNPEDAAINCPPSTRGPGMQTV